MITWSAHLSMLFSEEPPLARPAAAAAAGFTTVESWWPDAVPEAWAVGITHAGLRVASLNTPHHSGDSCGPWLNDPAKRGAALRDLESALALARRVGARAVNIPIGDKRMVRGRAGQLVEVADALAEFAGRAANAGVMLLVEPLSARVAPGYLVPDADTAAELIEAVGSGWVRMLFDAYHSAESGGDPAQDVRSHADLIAHVQYADCPGRGAPGTGRNSVWRLVDALDDVGYAGAIGLEYRPAGATVDSLGFISQRSLLSGVGLAPSATGHNAQARKVVAE